MPLLMASPFLWFGACGGSSNLPPVAFLTAQVVSGPQPLEVLLDASASWDPDGKIVKFQFDWEGDGTFDYTEAAASAPDGRFDGKTTHTFPADAPCAWTHAPGVWVTDDRGATAGYQIGQELFRVVVCNQLPVASITASPSNGAAPLVVNLDGSGSYDPDDPQPHFPGQGIIKFEWDFDYAGNPSAFKADESAARVQHTYAAAGHYTAALRVTDNEGDVSIATVTITVSPPAG